MIIQWSIYSSLVDGVLYNIHVVIPLEMKSLTIIVEKVLPLLLALKGATLLAASIEYNDDTYIHMQGCKEDMI